MIAVAPLLTLFTTTVLVWRLVIKAPGRIPLPAGFTVMLTSPVTLPLAVPIPHPRNLEEPPAFTLHGHDNRLVIEFPEGWLDNRPLTLADLENERDYLARQDFTLEISGR